ncbi:unnamed protein product [Scytosiphon promiscuus]
MIDSLTTLWIPWLVAARDPQPRRSTGHLRLRVRWTRITRMDSDEAAMLDSVLTACFSKVLALICPCIATFGPLFIILRSIRRAGGYLAVARSGEGAEMNANAACSFDVPVTSFPRNSVHKNWNIRVVGGPGRLCRIPPTGWFVGAGRLGERHKSK